MSLNFKGPFRLSTLFATKMCTQDNVGSIINVSTAETINPNARATVYAREKCFELLYKSNRSFIWAKSSM